MNIQDIMNSGANVSITISAADLQEVINYTVTTTRKELEQFIVEDKAEAYLSPNQVSDILNVDLSTLWRWKKKGFLVPIEIGGKRRYRKSEITAKFLNQNSTK
jgi:predicted DNA-binding transcriptional regulator AlpA